MCDNLHNLSFSSFGSLPESDDEPMEQSDRGIDGALDETMESLVTSGGHSDTLGCRVLSSLPSTIPPSADLFSSGDYSSTLGCRSIRFSSSSVEVIPESPQPPATAMSLEEAQLGRDEEEEPEGMDTTAECRSVGTQTVRRRLTFPSE